MPFRPRLLDTLPSYNTHLFSKDVAAGITVGIVALPLALAIAIASGLPPQAGVWTAIIGGFIVSLLGGSNVQIGGPANAFIVVVYSIVLQHGMVGMLLATLMAGGLMVLMGLLKLGRLMRHVPDALIAGFTSAIAAIILATQLKDALGLPIVKAPADVPHLVAAIAQSLTRLNPWALLLSGGAVLVMMIWLRIQSRVKAFSRIPASMIALLVLSLMAYGLNIPAETIGQRFGAAFEQMGALPQISVPSVSLAQLPALIGSALTLALLSGIESLLCARIADEQATTLSVKLPTHEPNQELIAQGIANMAVATVGGMAVTGTIARTVTNLRSGGTTPIAGMVHSLTLLAILLVAAPLAKHVPLATLAGILLYLAWNMLEWRQFTTLHREPRAWSLVFLATFVVTLLTSLTWGIAAGLLVAQLMRRAQPVA
jgi:sulfate permease, SulP family